MRGTIENILWQFCGAANPGCAQRAPAPFSRPLGHELDFFGLCCTMPARHEAGENTCALVSGLFRFSGGLKGRLSALAIH